MKATVKILRNDRNIPQGKLADAELHFTGGELDGLKLIRFAVWQRRDGVGQNVTFPARQFTVHGEAQFRAPARDRLIRDVQDRVRELVLQAYRLRGRTGISRSRVAMLTGCRRDGGARALPAWRRPGRRGSHIDGMRGAQ